MSKDANGPTNGGSKFEANGGLFEVNERENEIKLPKDVSAKIVMSDREEDYMEIALIPDKEIEHEM